MVKWTVGSVMRRSGMLSAVVALLISTQPLSAQKGGLDDFSWLAGTWRGEGPQGAVAEIHFMPPAAGVLPSLFRLFQAEETLVLETISLRQEPEGVFMYVRHFDPALVPLEAEEALKLRLVPTKGDSLVFENEVDGRNPRRSVMRPTKAGFESRSELARPDGSTDTIRVEYRRAQSNPGLDAEGSGAGG